jgi:hypothetical protein
MKMFLSHNIILPKYLRIVKEKGSRMSKTRAREGGASVFSALFYFFRISAPPSARSKNFRAKPKQAGKKEGGWGEGIFARLLCPPKAGWGWEAFPPFDIKPNIKAKQFSIPFKGKKCARKIQKIERKLFCFARRNSAGGNAGAGLKVKIGIFVKKGSDFVQRVPQIETSSFEGVAPRGRAPQKPSSLRGENEGGGKRKTGGFVTNQRARSDFLD